MVLLVEDGGEVKWVGIMCVYLEEDVGKLTYAKGEDGKKYSYVDFN